jgi:DNA polymerase III epsilon subunit-like protein
MYLFFDTETTGLPLNWKAPVTDINNWPRLVQLAYLVFDKNGELHCSGDFIVKPSGFIIPKEASRIHGITTEIALNKGVELNDVLKDFETKVDGAEILVAHNLKFDEKIMGAELLRNQFANNLTSKKGICTMEASVDFCGLIGGYGLKWPKLSELHYKLFGFNFEAAHNAAADINATAKCFWELKRIGIIK